MSRGGVSGSEVSFGGRWTVRPAPMKTGELTKWAKEEKSLFFEKLMQPRTRVRRSCSSGLADARPLTPQPLASSHDHDIPTGVRNW